MKIPVSMLSKDKKKPKKKGGFKLGALKGKDKKVADNDGDEE